MIEFTKSEINALRFSMFKVMADAVAECGPYRITKTEKRFKVMKDYDPSTVRYYSDFYKVVNIVHTERSRNIVEWIARYGRENVFTNW